MRFLPISNETMEILECARRNMYPRGEYPYTEPPADDEEQRVNVTGQLANGKNGKEDLRSVLLYAAIGVGALLLLIVIIVIICVSRRKQQKKRAPGALEPTTKDGENTGGSSSLS
ncbi:hypothetical protein GCK32_008948 [Trichostrongylus colubriformis]|uniref:Uncharacterized protein n=1 Tax=Trichostrongylus colubriformis TaxID=6319 RepID=A0AAN8FNS1_TRICO